MDRIVIQGRFETREADSRSLAVDFFTRNDFAVEAATRFGFVASASPDTFGAAFGAEVAQRRVVTEKRDGGRTIRWVSHVAPDGSLSIPVPSDLEGLVRAVIFAPLVKLEHDAIGPSGGSSELRSLDSLVGILGMGPLHNGGHTGAGVRVALVDTGFTNRERENSQVDAGGCVEVKHPIRKVLSVKPAGGTGGALPVIGFSGNVIELPVTYAGSLVDVEYSCLHPSVSIQPNRLDLHTVGNVNEEEGDGIGHGCGVGAHLLAVAKDIHLTVVRSGYATRLPDGTWEGGLYHTAGLTKAVDLDPKPDIIVCPWSVEADDEAMENVESDLDDAAERGIVVVVAGGGDDRTDGGQGMWPIALPRVISAGGAYPRPARGMEATPRATSFTSVRHEQRVVPDVVGVMRGGEGSGPFEFPTQASSYWDTGSTVTTPDDGWVVDSGTSTSAAQVAGVAACLLQKWPHLSPLGVKNALIMGGVDVVHGRSGSGQRTGTGWDPATGWGVVNGAASVAAIGRGFAPSLRELLAKDWFGRRVITAVSIRKALQRFDKRNWRLLWRLVGGASLGSPDIVVRASPDAEDWLGITTKHRDDLSVSPDAGRAVHVFVRVENRGRKPGSVLVYLSVHEDIGGSGHEIGQVAVDDIGAAEYVVSDPIRWKVDSASPRALWLKARLRDASGNGLPRNSNTEAWLGVKVRRTRT